MRGFTIRVAKEKDIKAISRFGTPVAKEMRFYNKEHTAGNIYEMSVKYLKNAFKYYNSRTVIALAKDGNIVGLCMHYPGHGHVDWLDWLLVDKRFRKMGLGKALIDYAIKDAKKQGCHKMWCDSNPGNKPMLKFMPKIGFRKVGTLKKHAYREDEILWEKLFN